MSEWPKDPQRGRADSTVTWKISLPAIVVALTFWTASVMLGTTVQAGPVVGLVFVEGPDEPIDCLNIPGFPPFHFIQPWQMTAADTEFVLDGAFQGVTEEQVRAAVIAAVKRKFFSILTPSGSVLDIEFRTSKVSGPGTVNVLLGKHNLAQSWFGFSLEGGGLGAEADGASNSAVSIDRINSLLQLDFTTFDSAINAIANVTAHEVGHLLALDHVWAAERPDLGWQTGEPVVANPYDLMSTANYGLPEDGWIQDNVFTTVPGTQTGGLSSVDRLIQATGLRSFVFRSSITPNGAGYDLSWTSQQGKVYDLLSSPDLATPAGIWEVYDPDGPGGTPPHGDLPPTGTGTNILTITPSEPRLFFSVVEKAAP